MNQSKFEGKHSNITDLIRDVFFNVHRIMACGFNQQVYENSLAIGLRKAVLQVAQQREIEVHNELR